MDTKISDAVLAVGVSVIIIMFMLTAEELIGIKFMSIVAMVEKEDAYAAALPGASYGICRMEGPILPPGSRNAALWVSPGVLVP